MRVAVLAILVACGNSSPDAPAPPPPPSPPTPVAVEIPAGPVPVALPPLEPAQRRTIKFSDGFVAMDAKGVVRWGHPAPGYAGEVLPADGSLFTELYPVKGQPPQHHQPRDLSTLTPEYDAVAKLSHANSLAAVLLVDAAAPARLAMRRIVDKFGSEATAFAGGAANTTTLYDFGGSVGSDPYTHAELTLRVDHIADLGHKHPFTVLLEYGDATTTGELVAALGKLGEAGIEHVRVHRMMGWGPIPPSEIEWVNGAAATDDEITPGDPATVEIGDVVVDANLDAQGVKTALNSWAPRFRYCFEKRSAKLLKGAITLAFDVAADATTSHATGKGFDATVGACMAGALFDLDLAPNAVRGAGHVVAAVSFTRPPPPPPEVPEAKPVSGYWCWIYPAGDAGLCAPLQEECEAALTGAKQAAAALHDTVVPGPCKAQPTAWSSDGTHFSPTRKTCGENCKQSR